MLPLGQRSEQCVRCEEAIMVLVWRFKCWDLTCWWTTIESRLVWLLLSPEGGSSLSSSLNSWHTQFVRSFWAGRWRIIDHFCSWKYQSHTWHDWQMTLYQEYQKHLIWHGWLVLDRVWALEHDRSKTGFWLTLASFLTLFHWTHQY